MKKIKKLLVIAMLLLFSGFANALEVMDVRADHWAAKEIIHSIQNEYIRLDKNNNFKPESTMTRSEFVTSLLKVIRRQDEPFRQRTSFKDIKRSTPNEDDILRSEQIRMAFGYPDRTFKPTRNINHNETMAMIANITKDDYTTCDITRFKDYKQIPIWAERSYIKNVAHGFYINYPDGLKFKPYNNLTRAEAAVIFYRVSQNLDVFKDEYRDLYDRRGWQEAQFIQEDNLNLVDFAPNDKVQIYDTKKIIEAGNILIATDVTDVRSRKDNVGDTYVFTAPNDVYTKQGTFLFPQGTEFYARDEKKGYSAWRSRPEKSNVVFYKYSLPSGATYDMAGVPYTKGKKVIYTNEKTKKKNLAFENTSTQEGLIKYAHQMSPVIDYKTIKGKTIYLLLTGEMVIPQSSDYVNFRRKKPLPEQDTRL